MMLKNKLVLYHDSSIAAIEGDVGIVSYDLGRHVHIHDHPLQLQLTIDAVE